MLAAVVAPVRLLDRSGATGHRRHRPVRELGTSRDPTAQAWLFLGFFIAFAIKAPLWPLHTWLPDAAAAARPTPRCC